MNNICPSRSLYHTSIQQRRNFFGFLLAAIGIVDEFIRAQVILQRLGEVMDASPEDAQDAHKPWVELSATADIYCEKLRFHHSGRVDLLQDLDLVIPGSGMTALIGRSGCGKSTLAKLLSGLYQPQSGNIRYGIYDRRDLALDCLRQQVVMLEQGQVVSQGTPAELRRREGLHRSFLNPELALMP